MQNKKVHLISSLLTLNQKYFIGHQRRVALHSELRSAI